MKLFAPAEVKQANERELAKDILRTRSTKEALAKVTAELDSTNARFESALANQRVRWQEAEQEATAKLAALEKKIQEQENKLVPIEPTSEEVHTLYEKAKKLMADAEAKSEDVALTVEVFQDRLDALSEAEEDARIRLQKIEIKEKAIAGQESMVKNLSQELDLKWKEYFKAINK